MTFSRLLVRFLSVLALTAAFAAPAFCEEEEPVALTLLYSNNTNGILKACKCPGKPLGGLARRATVIDSLRQEEPNVLLLDAGDFLAASALADRNPVILDAMEAMAYDAAAIGEHELFGGAVRFRALTEGGSLPLVSANAQYTAGGDSSLLGQPHVLKEYGETRVAVVGVLAPKLIKGVRADVRQGLGALDPVQTLRRQTELLRDKADLLVVLSHAALERNKLLAQQIPEIDVLVGAHSRHLLESPISVGNTLIVQAGRNGEYLGALRLQIAEGRIVSAKNEMIPMGPEIPDHPQVGGLIQAYFDKREGRTVPPRSSLSVRPEAPRVVLEMYLSKECDTCKDIKEDFLPTLVRKLGITLTVRDRDVDDPKIYDELVRTEERLGDTDNEVPIVVFGNRIFGGEEEIRAGLEQAIKSSIEQEATDSGP